MKPEILSQLICPKTQEALIFDSKNNCLLSVKAGLRYPITNGIAILLVDEATKI